MVNGLSVALFKRTTQQTHALGKTRAILFTSYIVLYHIPKFFSIFFIKKYEKILFS